MNNSLVRSLVTLLRFLLVENWPITMAAVLGFAAIYLLLPRPRASARSGAVVIAAAALLLTGALIVRVGQFSPETVLFYAFSGIAIIAGGLLITQSNPARAALSFALVVLSTCGLFLLQAAPFLMAATTIIYAGAIVVTFLFVIMLAQQEGLSDADQRSRKPLLASLTGFILLGALLYVLRAGYGTEEIDRLIAQAREAASRDTFEEIARGIGDSREPGDKGLFHDFKQAILAKGSSVEARALAADIDNFILPAWTSARARRDPAKARDVLADLEEIGLRARASFGALQPSPDQRLPLSNLSGPTPAQGFFEPPSGKDSKKQTAGEPLRRDEQKRPQLPHENTAYLGRALFTDYLLAVEFGGTLLLVATIGAIAIASRRGERRA